MHLRRRSRLTERSSRSSVNLSSLAARGCCGFPGGERRLRSHLSSASHGVVRNRQQHQPRNTRLQGHAHAIDPPRRNEDGEYGCATENRGEWKVLHANGQRPIGARVPVPAEAIVRDEDQQPRKEPAEQRNAEHVDVRRTGEQVGQQYGRGESSGGKQQRSKRSALGE